jgi:hypothetical protein
MDEKKAGLGARLSVGRYDKQTFKRGTVDCSSCREEENSNCIKPTGYDLIIAYEYCNASICSTGMQDLHSSFEICTGDAKSSFKLLIIMAENFFAKKFDPYNCIGCLKNVLAFVAKKQHFYELKFSGSRKKIFFSQ